MRAGGYIPHALPTSDATSEFASLSFVNVSATCADYTTVFMVTVH